MKLVGFKKLQNRESGMTLLEVIFAIMILLVLAMTSASLIRNGVELQMSLSQQSKVSHRMSVAIKKLSSDLEHAFLIDRKRPEYLYTSRTMKTHFSVKTRGNVATLMMTTMNHRPLVENSPEGDQTFVVYKLELDNDTGMTHLRRGTTKGIPERFRDNIPTQIIAQNIKSFRIKAWDGIAWKDTWNSDKSTWRDLLPHMVEIEVEAYEEDPLEGDRFDDSEDQASSLVRTVIYLPRAQGMKDIKKPSSQPKYY